MLSQLNFRRALWILLALGTAWRLERYVLQMPLWGDEAALALNFLDQDFSGLLSPLANAQVSPILFLWLEKLIMILMGPSELAMRLLPLMAGLGGLWLFLLLARRVVEPLPAAMAVGILAVSYFAVRHSVEVKPYSCDLLAAVALQLSAAAYLREHRLNWLIAWALIAPVAILISFPGVFIFGASAVAILIYLHGKSSRERGIWLAGCGMSVGAFVWMFWATSSNQYDSLQTPMTTYWQESFPPATWWKIPFWLLETHAGNMMAYPIGGKRWASTGTLILCLVGLAVSLKKWPRSLLILFVLPFLLTLMAAAMHRYPYGGSARIAQHLAPAICLWAGLGIVWLIGNFQKVRWRRRNVLAIFGLLATVGIIGMARDILRPSKTPGDSRARGIVREWTSPTQSEGIYLVWEPMHALAPNFQWYLRTSGREIFWNAREDQSWAPARGPVYALSFDRNVRLATKFPGFRVMEESTEDILVGPPEMGPAHWQSIRLEPLEPPINH